MARFRVYTHDNVLRFRVASVSRPGEVEHVVDVSSFEGNGECSCEHFQFRLLPALEAGNPHVATRCSHIMAAREACLNNLIQKITGHEINDTSEKSGEQEQPG
jgi:hypothetical protein